MVMHGSFGAGKLGKDGDQSGMIIFVFLRGNCGSSIEQRLLLNVYLLVFPGKICSSKNKVPWTQ